MAEFWGKVARFFAADKLAKLIEFSYSITPRLGLSLMGGALAYLVPPERIGVERHTSAVIAFLVVTCLLGVWYGTEYRYRRQCDRARKLFDDQYLTVNQRDQALKEAFNQYMAAQRFRGHAK